MHSIIISDMPSYTLERLDKTHQPPDYNPINLQSDTFY